VSFVAPMLCGSSIVHDNTGIGEIAHVTSHER
jgi:hypothetical protein